MPRMFRPVPTVAAFALLLASSTGSAFAAGEVGELAASAALTVGFYLTVIGILLAAIAAEVWKNARDTLPSGPLFTREISATARVRIEKP